MENNLNEIVIYVISSLILVWLVLQFISLKFIKGKMPFFSYLPLVFNRRKYLTETGKRIDNFVIIVTILILISLSLLYIFFK